MNGRCVKSVEICHYTRLPPLTYSTVKFSTPSIGSFIQSFMAQGGSGLCTGYDDCYEYQRRTGGGFTDCN